MQILDVQVNYRGYVFIFCFNNPVFSIFHQFKAELFLESVEINQNYPLLLLHLISKEEVDITIRISGSVAFKNYIKRNWTAHLVKINKLLIINFLLIKLC